jgi:parallel beta-helix repeat protein
MDIDSTSITTANMIVGELTFQDGMYYQVNIENGSPMIRNAEFTGTISVASVISRSGHPVILNSTFSANDTGFYAHDGSEPELIMGCTFSSSAAQGIYLTSAASGEITRNTFQSGYVGIYLYAVPTIYGGTNSAANVHHNTFSGNGWGIYLRAASGGTGENTISRNRFLKNTYGIVSDADSASVETSLIDSNRFDGQGDYALFMEDTSHDVVNNLFTSNAVDAIVSVRGTNNIAFNTVANNSEDGISLENSDASLVVNNITYQNAQYGIVVDGTSVAAELGGNDNVGNVSGAISGAYVDLGGNVSVNPRFVSATNYDLRPTSPLIDVAIATYSIGYDITGAVRTTPDIGAYEF